MITLATTHVKRAAPLACCCGYTWTPRCPYSPCTSPFELWVIMNKIAMVTAESPAHWMYFLQDANGVWSQRTEKWTGCLNRLHTSKMWLMPGAEGRGPDGCAALKKLVLLKLSRARRTGGESPARAATPAYYSPPDNIKRWMSSVCICL